MKDPAEIKVTQINNWFHVRLFYNGQLWSEYRCKLRLDIKFCVYEQLRTLDKCGSDSWMATASRKRRNRKFNAAAGNIELQRSEGLVAYGKVESVKGSGAVSWLG